MTSDGGHQLFGADFDDGLDIADISFSDILGFPSDVDREIHHALFGDSGLGMGLVPEEQMMPPADFSDLLPASSGQDDLVTQLLAPVPSALVSPAADPADGISADSKEDLLAFFERQLEPSQSQSCPVSPAGARPPPAVSCPSSPEPRPARQRRRVRRQPPRPGQSLLKPSVTAKLKIQAKDKLLRNQHQVEREGLPTSSRPAVPFKEAAEIAVQHQLLPDKLVNPSRTVVHVVEASGTSVQHQLQLDRLSSGPRTAMVVTEAPGTTYQSSSPRFGSAAAAAGCVVAADPAPQESVGINIVQLIQPETNQPAMIKSDPAAEQRVESEVVLLEQNALEAITLQENVPDPTTTGCDQMEVGSDPQTRSEVVCQIGSEGDAQQEVDLEAVTHQVVKSEVIVPDQMESDVGKDRESDVADVESATPVDETSAQGSSLRALIHTLKQRAKVEPDRQARAILWAQVRRLRDTLKNTKQRAKQISRTIGLRAAETSPDSEPGLSGETTGSEGSALTSNVSSPVQPAGSEPPSTSEHGLSGEPAGSESSALTSNVSSPVQPAWSEPLSANDPGLSDETALTSNVSSPVHPAWSEPLSANDPGLSDETALTSNVSSPVQLTGSDRLSPSEPGLSGEAAGSDCSALTPPDEWQLRSRCQLLVDQQAQSAVMWDHSYCWRALSEPLVHKVPDYVLGQPASTDTVLDKVPPYVQGVPSAQPQRKKLSLTEYRQRRSAVNSRSGSPGPETPSPSTLWPQPELPPVPESKPALLSVPEPQPFPVPVPVPQPAPVPAHELQSVPVPNTTDSMNSSSRSSSSSCSIQLAPVPTPELQPVPVPVPQPAPVTVCEPQPVPVPGSQPAPAVEPEPAPVHARKPEPTPVHVPQTAHAPRPGPVPAVEPQSVLLPVANAASSPSPLPSEPGTQRERPRRCSPPSMYRLEPRRSRAQYRRTSSATNTTGSMNSNGRSSSSSSSCSCSCSSSCSSDRSPEDPFRYSPSDFSRTSGSISGSERSKQSHGHRRARSPGRSRSRRRRQTRSRSRSRSRSERHRRTRSGSRGRRRSRSRSRRRRLEQERAERERRRQQEEELNRQEAVQRRVVYINGLPTNVSREAIRKMFAPYGVITRIRIKNREPGGHVYASLDQGCYAFVTYASHSAAVAAQLQGSKHFPHLEIKFGGRREFCLDQYADPDADFNNRAYYSVNGRPAADPAEDFDAMLKREMSRVRNSSGKNAGRS